MNSIRQAVRIVTVLTAACADARTPEVTHAPGAVTSRDAADGSGTFTEKILGMKTGFAAAFGDGGPYQPMVNFGFNGRLESAKYFLEFGANLLLPVGSSERAGYGGLVTELGASYYLGQESVSPYVGAGVLPRLVFGDNIDSSLNLAAYSQLGLMFARESSTRLYVDLRATQSLSPIQRTRDPTELALNVGIGW